MVFSSHAHKNGRAWYVRTVLLSVVVVGVLSLISVRFFGQQLDAGCGASCYTGTYPALGDERVVALTFDDGPAGPATDRILATLAEYDVPATFFLVGQQIYEHPDQVRAIAKAGHIIGNHTFTSDETRVHESRKRLYSELNKTNALVESLTGRSAVLYRVPSLVDHEPFEVTPPPGSKEVWDWVYQAGYVPVGVDFDSNDWKVRTAGEVVANMREELSRSEIGYYDRHTHVVLLHDLPRTAEALPEILTMLRHEGYRVVPLTDLLAMSRADAMPHAGTDLQHLTSAVMLSSSGWFLDTLFVLAVLMSFIGFARAGVFVWAIVRRRRRGEMDTALPPFPGTVSVLIPAWNEQENIASTIRSVLQNTRVPDEVLVIDDGSRDDTTTIAHEVAKEYPGLVRVITKENGGKASALNMGIHAARGEVVVAIDGDTVLDAGCIDALVRPFAWEHIGAVAGKIVPANADRLLEKYQVLEYAVGQNIDKEVVSALGSVHVVPGAVGAWRKKVVQEVGGYSTDTLVEDQDLTLALLAYGHSVVYVREAIAYTEVPQSMRSFYLQRFRWTYGTFQCLWKYRSELFADRSMRLGWISLPYSFVFNVFMPVLSLALALTMVLLAFLDISHPSVWMFLVFLVIDLVYAFIGVRMDPTVPTSMVPLVALQRMVYLFVYALITALVIMKVLDGSPTRWNKLVRIGAAGRFFTAGSTHTAPVPGVG